MFDIDDFIGECETARSDATPQVAIAEVLRRTVARRAEVAATLRPAKGGITLLHHTPDLTILDVVWAPGMRIFPHDHRMWAAIAIYTGREDNSFFRRASPSAPTLTPSGGKQLDAGDVAVLGDDTIHAVANPLRELTGAIHVYGGDFVNQSRSQWGPGEQVERPYDLATVNEMFAAANSTLDQTARG